MQATESSITKPNEATYYGASPNTAPIALNANLGASGVSTPIWCQLPKSPAHCPITGLSRSKINELILPCVANDFKPPVKSRSLKAYKWAKRGIRLYYVPSLLAWIEAQDASTPTA